MLQSKQHSLDLYEFIGVIGKPHGLKGHFYISQIPRVLGSSFKTLLVGKSIASAELYGVEITRNNDNIVKLKADFDRTAIESMAGLSLWALKEELAGFHLSRLLGVNVEDCQGQVLGQVQQFFNYGASDTVAIFNAEKGLLELPFIAEYFADFTDLTEKTPSALKLRSLSAADISDFWAEPE